MRWKSCHTIDFLIALYYLSIIVLVINWKFVLSEILLSWEEENPCHKACVFITIKPKKAIIEHEQFNFICGAEMLFVPFWFPPFSVNLWWKSSFQSQIARTATILAGACTGISFWRRGEDEFNDGESSWEILFWHAIPTTAARFGVQ